jgi:D-amino-acid dehydrogenase
MLPQSNSSDGAFPPAISYWEVPVETVGHRAHVTVIGAGIVGLASAAALCRAGCDVTVVDAAPGPGRGASAGNGCQLSYGYVAPLAQPDLLAELPRLLLAAGAPLKIRPRFELAQWRWMLEFLGACRRPVARHSTLALLALGAVSRYETECWMADTDAAALSFGRHGKLVLLPTPQALKAARRQLELQAGRGPAQRVVSEAECMTLEPALGAFRGRVAGAVYTAGECVVDSFALCLDLERKLRQRGVVFEYGVRVTGFETRNGRIAAILADAGRRPVDNVLLASGSGCAALGRMLGVRLPVAPLKGYSITAQIRRSQAAPIISITDAARKIVYARLGNRLRAAGMAELAGEDHRLNPQRVAQLVESMCEAFGAGVDRDSIEPWTGLRPATPTSVPLIARSSKSPNLFFNVGHGALGLTLAFGSARRLADLICAGK